MATCMEMACTQGAAGHWSLRTCVYVECAADQRCLCHRQFHTVARLALCTSAGSIYSVHTSGSHLQCLQHDTALCRMTSGTLQCSLHTSGSHQPYFCHQLLVLSMSGDLKGAVACVNVMQCRSMQHIGMQGSSACLQRPPCHDVVQYACCGFCEICFG